MAGRPRKPASVKILQGTFRADRNPVNEPQIDPPPKDKMKCPSTLNRWGKKFWKEHVNLLADSKILTAADLPAFEMLCQAWGAFKEAEYDIHHFEQTGTKRTLAQYRQCRDYNRKNMPEIMEMNENRTLFGTLSAQFGMTPVARNKIDIPKVKQTDTLSEMYEEMKAQA